MPRRTPRRPLPPLALLLITALPAVALAQPYEFENVLMLSNEDPLDAGLSGEDRYIDLWGFVGTNGREYVIQAHTGGTLWWDVEDPVHPVLVQDIPGPVSNWRDIFVIGNYAYASSENFVGGVQIFDIADPTNPAAIGAYTATVGGAHNIFGDPNRNLLYVVGGFQNGANGGLQILDATDPVNLVEIGQWSNQYIHDISVEGNVGYACLINIDRFRLLDLADSTAPANLGTLFLDPAGSVHSSWPKGDGVHVLICHEKQGGHVRSLDVSNPSSIQSLDQLNPFPMDSAHNVHVQGNTAYVSWYERGTRIIDYTDESNLVEIGWFDTLPETRHLFAGNWGVYPHLPSGIIAASDRTHGLFLLQYDTDVATLQGTISSDVDGPIENARVHLAQLDNTLRTDAVGLYRFSAPAGTHTLTVSAFGHDPDSVVAVVGAGGTTVTNLTLVKQPTGTVGGTIADAVTAMPLEAVNVGLVSQGESFFTSTDATGHYTFASFPTGPADVSVVRYGYAPAEVSITIPAGGSTGESFRLAPAAISLDFSSAPGWTVENDTLGTFLGGTWELGVPPTMTNWNQPTEDHTLDPEDMCFVTGLADTTPDGHSNLVHDGRSKLISPPFDLSSMAEPHVFYHRWVWTTAEVDEWVVEVSSDGVSWVEMERTRFRAAEWVPVDVNLQGLLPSYDSVRVRFTAQEEFNTLGMEAGVDDLSFYDGAGGPVSSPGGPHIAPPRLGLALRPNPFADATSVRFSLPASAPTKLTVHDIRGAHVATLVQGVLEPGAHRVVWNGTNSAGRQVSTGFYFLRLESGGRMRAEKVLRVH